MRDTDAYAECNTADTHALSNSDSDTNGHSYTDDDSDANCDGYRYSQGYGAAAPDASSSSKSTVIAGLWIGSDRLCFSEREDGSQDRGYSIYGFT